MCVYISIVAFTLIDERKIIPTSSKRWQVGKTALLIVMSDMRKLGSWSHFCDALHDTSNGMVQHLPNMISTRDSSTRGHWARNREIDPDLNIAPNANRIVYTGATARDGFRIMPSDACWRTLDDGTTSVRCQSDFEDDRTLTLVMLRGPNYNGEFLPLISSTTPNIIVMENIVKRWLQCKNSIQTIANYAKS